MNEGLPNFPGRKLSSRGTNLRRDKLCAYLQGCVCNTAVSTSPPFRAFIGRFVMMQARGNSQGGQPGGAVPSDARTPAPARPKPRAHGHGHGEGALLQRSLSELHVSTSRSHRERQGSRAARTHTGREMARARHPEPENTDLPGTTPVLNGDQLVCVGLELPYFPHWLAKKWSHLTSIDVTGGHLSNLEALEACTSLETLICDQNRLMDGDLPNLPNLPDSLRAISLNRNKIASLLGFIGFAVLKFPNITFLSLLGNPCCASELTESTVKQVAAYREKLILALPQLGWIDAVVTVDDRLGQSNTLNCRGINSESIPLWTTQGPSISML